MDWASFDTPFGPRSGAEVPELFDKLADANARVRSRALQDLHRRLVAVGGGYGTPYLDVALAALPRLEALLDPQGDLADGRAGVLKILGDVAAGDHRRHLGRGLTAAHFDVDEIGPARAIQAGVASLSPRIVACLTAAKPEIRAAAAFALAWIPDAAETSREALLERLKTEKKPVVRAAILLALGYVDGPIDVLRACSGEPAPVGTAAAVASMCVAPADMAEALDVALAPLPKPVVAGLFFNDGALGQIATFAMRDATVRRGDLALHEALVARLPPALRPLGESWTVLVAARAPDLTPRDPLDPGDLPERARGVLSTLAATLQSNRNPHLYQAFWRAGLFMFRDSNERALGLTSSGPLDQRALGRPLWWWLHGARSGRVSFEQWREAVDGFEVRAILEDAATLPYELYRDRFRRDGYDIEPLLAVLTRTAEHAGVASTSLDARFAELRAAAAKPTIVAGKGAVAWP